jgi:large subunit ribosomal protein L10
MAKTREQKEQIVEKLSSDLKKAKIVIFAAFSGLKVADSDQLRKDLKENNNFFKIIKTSLVKIALKNAGVDATIDQITQPLAIVLGNSDELTAPKTIHLFGKKNEALQILGGIYQNTWIEGEQIKKLAQIPGRETLEAHLVGSLAQPIARLNNALSGNLRSLVYILSQYQNSK